MSKKISWTIIFVLIIGACDEETVGNDTDIDSLDVNDESDANETDSKEIDDSTMEDIISDENSESIDYIEEDGGELPAECGTMMIPGCGEGRLCVQTLPPYCNSEYTGYCMTIPDDCSGIPDNTICTCDTFTSYRNECEARMAGYGGLLVDCPSEP